MVLRSPFGTDVFLSITRTTLQLQKHLNYLFRVWFGWFCVFYYKLPVSRRRHSGPYLNLIWLHFGVLPFIVHSSSSANFLFTSSLSCAFASAPVFGLHGRTIYVAILFDISDKFNAHTSAHLSNSINNKLNAMLTGRLYARTHNSVLSRKGEKGHQERQRHGVHECYNWHSESGRWI